jgi:hypothetical protein
MDDYLEDSAHITNGLTASILKTLTPEERTVQWRWGRSVLGLYCAVLLLGGIVIVASQPSPNPNHLVAQVAAARIAH